MGAADADGPRDDTRTWMRALSDGVQSADHPVAWSRHNLVAYGDVDVLGACVALVSVAEGSKHAAQPVARLHAPPRPATFPGVSTAPAPLTLEPPTLVSFSPCGYTLLAYFPMSACVSGETSMAGASAALPLGRTPSTDGVAPAPLPTLEQMASTASFSAAPSPATTPFPTTPTPSDAPGAAPAHALPPQQQPSDQGVLCIWTRPAAGPPGAWTMKQCIPVAPATCHAPAALVGDIAEALWLGGPGQWHVDPAACADGVAGGSTTSPPFHRAPSRGPGTFSARTALCPEERQEEQLLVLVTSAGQVAFLHRLGDASGESSASCDTFRLYTTWLHEPSVQPPPATMEPVMRAFATERMDLANDAVCTRPRPLQLSHLACTVVPNEPVVLVAYVSAQACLPELISLTEIQIEVDREMTFFTTNPQSPIPALPSPLVSARDAVPRDLLVHAETLARLAWAPPRRDGTLQLLCALCVQSRAATDLCAEPRAVGTHLVSWDVRRRSVSTAGVLRSVFPPVPAHAATSASAEAPAADDSLWAPTPAADAWLAGVYITGVVTASDGLPVAGSVLAACLRLPCSAADGRAEEWRMLDMPSLASRQLTALPPAMLQRSALTLSPTGTLACALRRPQNAPAFLSLPFPHAVSPPAFTSVAGRVLALSLLRNADCADAAHWTRTQAPADTRLLPDVVAAVSAALRFHGEKDKLPTLRQTMHLTHVLLALTSGCSDARERALHQRAHLFVQITDMYTALTRARADTFSVQFSAQLIPPGADAIAFSPAAVHMLLRRLAVVLRWLEQSSRAAIAAAVPGDAARGTTAAPFEVDALLALLAIHEPRSLFYEVLAGLAVFATWLAEMPLQTWSMLIHDCAGSGADVPASLDEYRTELAQLDLARAVLTEVLDNAAVDLRAAVDAVRPVTDTSDAHAFWTSLFAPERTKADADAVHAIARVFVAQGTGIVRNPVALWTAAPEALAGMPLGG
ncbi:hypothetical protein MSPP1_001275 [Malassezia sp. CBS 17886]|nr:hypothetical protein MSPP1_001275 [Malassezia sp. CBS 17886]